MDVYIISSYMYEAMSPDDSIHDWNGQESSYDHGRGEDIDPPAVGGCSEDVALLPPRHAALHLLRVYLVILEHGPSPAVRT